MFLVFSIFSATCSLTLHRAGLNDWGTPISMEYANGNRLAMLFFFSSLGLILVTGLLYRCYGHLVQMRILFVVFLLLGLVIASKPHSITHFYSFYATVGGAILAPLFALSRLKIWSCLFCVIAASIAALMFPILTTTIESGNVGFGITQRAWFFVAWLSNASVLYHCQQVATSRGRPQSL